MEKRKYLKQVKDHIDGLKKATAMILEAAKEAEDEDERDAILTAIDFAQQELWTQL